MLLDLFNQKKNDIDVSQNVFFRHMFTARIIWIVNVIHGMFFFSQTNFFIVSINIYVIFSPLSKINFVEYFSNTLNTHYFVQLIFFQKHHFCTKLKKPFTADVLIRVLFWMRTIWSLCVTEWKWKVHREVLFLSFRGAASYEHFGVEWFYFVILCFEGQGRDLPLTRVWNDP